MRALSIMSSVFKRVSCMSSSTYVHVRLHENASMKNVVHEKKSLKFGSKFSTRTGTEQSALHPKRREKSAVLCCAACVKL